MIPEDDWYDVAEDDSAIEPAMLAMPLYDEDGNEIPEEELPWNNIPDESIVDDDSADWSVDDEPEESLPPSKPDKRRRNADKVRSSAELRNASPKASVKKRFADWNYLPEPCPSFRIWLTGTTAKKKAVCAVNAGMKRCVVMYRWKAARSQADTSFRIA